MTGVWLLLIAITYVFSPLLLGIPLLRRKHLMNKDFALRPLSADEVPDVQQRLAARQPELLAEGFEPVGSFVLENLAPGVASYFRLYRHPSPGLAALTTCAISGQATVGYDEIAQNYAGGRSLIVNNSSQSFAWKLPGRTLWRFADCASVAGLMQRYRWLHARRNEVPEAWVPGEELTRLRERMRQECEQQVEQGLYLNAETHWRLTWRGAAYMAWCHTFPGKHWRTARQLRTGRALERQAGLS